MNYFNYYGDYFPRCYDYSYYHNTNNYLKDYGGYPATFNINKLSNENNNYRISIFTSSSSAPGFLSNCHYLATFVPEQP